MDNLIFLDTETTGNDLLQDRLFEVCYLIQNQLQCELFTPPIPISIKSQSITHITNKMLIGKPVFKESAFKQNLQKILKDNILIAHNAAFDICMLSH